MKKIIFFAALLIVPFANAEYVRGYKDLDGSYVKGYYRNSFNGYQEEDDSSQSYTNVFNSKGDAQLNEFPPSRSIYDQDDTNIEPYSLNN